MKILKITAQHRRDFHAVLICEGCKHKQDLTRGYDDKYYHEVVLPSIVCLNCGKSRKDLGIPNPETVTKYPEGYQI